MPDFISIEKLTVSILSVIILLLCMVNVGSTVTCSSSCDAGEYLVSVNDSALCVECPSGFYCEGNQSAPQACPQGSANQITGQINSSACEVCLPGTYGNQAGLTSCLPCPAGFACPNVNTTVPNACVDGFYAVGSGEVGATDCIECPLGASCPFTFSVPIPCPSGFYSNETQATNCTQCPAGHHCPDPSLSPQACSPGSYAPAGSTVCLQCPLGTACPQTATESPQSCSLGQYSFNSSSECFSCPVGHFCTDPVLSPMACPAGTYNNVTGQTSCVSCEQGRQCLDGTDSQPCPAGSFSLELQVDCTPCVLGTYSPEGAGECIECPEGNYCSSPAASPLPCQSGHVAMGGQDNCTLCDTGLVPDSNQTICVDCLAGHYCPDPRQPPLPCPNGTYSLSGPNSVCLQCPQGYSCAVQDSLPQLCSVEAYSPLGATECLPCPAGSSCVNDSLPQPCVAGEYSLLGDPLCTICPSGSFCETTFDLPSLCPSGTYSNESSIACTPCPPGSYCPSTNSPPLPCPTGTYSVENTTACQPCLAGFACVSTDVEPVPCDPGYYSAAGNVMCTVCPPGFQCPLTDQPPEACPPGYVSDGGTTNCTACPSGHACPDIDSSLSITPCTPGTYSSGMQQTCNICPVGMYCPDTFSAAELPCEPGSFSEGNQTSCTPCPPGMACMASDGSSNVVCSPGTYSTTRSEVCITCPPGFACPQTDQALEVACQPGTFSVGMQTECTECPVGMECPFIDQATMTECSPGYYSLGNQSSCTPCPPGYECPSRTTNTETPCQAGYYSLGATDSCTRCTRGLSCPSTDSLPTPCSPGTYSMDGAINCTVCEAGHTCQDPGSDPVSCGLGTWSPSGSIACQSCDVGYQCLEASTTPTPSDQICSIGGWCDGRDRFQCPVGFYGNISGAGSQEEGCVICPPGHYCPNLGTTSFESNICPQGYYCPHGTTFAEEFPCPAGTFNNETMQTSIETGCTLICPATMFCPEGSTAGQTCPAGFYCPQGTPSAYHSPCPLGTYGPDSGYSDASQCVECQAGYYCPSGNNTHPTVSPLPCQPGTYNPLNGTGHEFNCLLCTAGMSCPTIALTEPSDTCNEGHYCPNGTIFPSQYPCPPGTFTFSTDLQSPDQCSICPAGQACGWGTGFNFSEPLPCAQGHYCPLGTPASNKYPCPPGTFTELSNLTSAAECSICTAGHYCIGGGAGPNDVCPMGHYCPEGTRLPHQFPCPKTTYNDQFGQNSSESCLNCTVGHFCESGFTTPEACPAGAYMPSGYDAVSDSTIGDPIGNKSDCLVCPGGQFCGEGSVVPIDCGLGMYSPTGSEFCFTCLVGHYCDENSTSEDNMRMNKQCPPGNYCAPGLSAVEESQLCATGFYCPQATPKELPCPPGTYNPLDGQASLSDCLSCTAGFYCLENASLPSGPCQPGFYCPTNFSNGQLPRNIGSYGPTQVPCPGGTYQENFTSASLDDCIECPEGSFCVEGSDVPETCTIGHYCTPGLNAPIPCPVGTIGSSNGLMSEAECDACPPGGFCDSPGLTSRRGPCDSGFVCYLGANTSTPTDGVTGEPCPAGGFCTLGSSASQPCPPGTFSNTSGSADSFDCSECTPGFFCSNARTPEPTGPCNAGYYCPGGAKTPNDTVTPAGHFTPEGSAAPIPCRVGFWMPHTAAGECLPCTAGHYCPNPGSTTVTLCQIGHYCEEGSFDPAPCPSGTFNNQTGLSASSECQSCPPGSFCAGGGLTEPEGLCTAGFACFGNSSLPNPIESDEVTFGGLCMAGHYCPMGSGGGIPCPAGTFSSSIGLTADTECTPCPARMHCNNSGLTQPSGECDPGYYCSGGAAIGSPSDGMTGDICPLGHFCVSGSSTPAPCLPGTYANSTGLSSCLSCPLGHFCHPSGTIEPEICPAGFYCLAGTALDYIGCPVGTLGLREGLADESQCTPCTAGYYCDSSPLTAPTGTCDPGYFCSSGATDPRPLETMANGPCPAGFYCPRNSSSPTPCPPGTYSPSTFNTEEADCTPCDPGRHCNVSGLTTVSGLCAEGYYCGNGSSTAFPLDSPSGDICPVAHYCPEGSSTPSPCQPGTFSNVTGSGACLACLAGFYCEGSTDDPHLYPCPPGHYCPQGTEFSLQFPCPLSTYSPSTSAIDSNTCLPCPTGQYCNGTGLDAPTGMCDPGSFCVPGSTSPSGEPCEPGFYCPPGANFALPCPPGEYCAGFALTSPSGFCDPGYYCIGSAITPQPTDGVTGDVCPMGHYCLGGSVNFTACPPGTFGRVTQARNESEGCETCTATMYCGEYGLTAPSGICDGGYYCPPGQRASDPFEFICPLGHFCTAGTLEPMRCPSSTYQDELGQTDCKLCPASFYCDNRFDPVVLFNDTICPQGYYCPNGTSFSTQFPCPNGTFSNLTGLAESSQCLDCTPGHYCGEPGLIQPSGLCFAGYFCQSGSTTPSPVDSTCPAGHYCPEGSVNPVPCLAGTHSGTTLNQNETACTLCGPGYYCPEGSVNSTALVCDPGFVCLFGAFVPTPVDGITGYPCPAGHSCVSGALSEEACTPGSYQPDTAQSVCITCPVGALCESTASLDFTPCPAGHYCPMEGMTDSIQCPTGTFSNTTGNTNLTDCLPCPRGMYCDAPGLVAPSGLCSAGFLCVSEATDIAPDDGVNGPCPVGFYCVEGATHPQPCPVGTLAPFSNTALNNDSSFLLEYFCDPSLTLEPLSAIGLENESECVPCIGGFYCQHPNSTLPTGPCSAGYYCPHNASITVATPSEFICPLGHFCTEASLAPTPCPLRTFSNSTGAQTCTACPVGHFCRIGTIEPHVCPPHNYCPAESSEPIFCPNGTYTDNNTLGLSAADQCTPCPAGHFCLAGEIAGECSAGHLCYQGSDVPNPDGSDTSIGDLCPEGFYCLQGAVNATACPLGLFNVMRGGRQVEDCTDCPPGRVCSGNVATLCPPGFYCNSGIPLPCPAGTYNLLQGVSMLIECLSCEPGFLCPNESTVTFVHNPCPVGHYCLVGSITPTPCPYGNHRNVTTAASVSDCYPCPPQFYCPDNATVHGIPCNITDICLEGTVTPLPCPAGFYCPQTDLQLPCPPGSYCPEGSAWYILCPRDHYCTQPACEGAFISRAGASMPEICPLGFREILNLGENFTRSSLEVTCEPCPPGSYMNASSANEDRTCFTCPEGFHCFGGSIFGDQGVTPMFNASICPAGHYCEAGSPSPTACDMGTFNPLEGQSNSSVCELCPLGSFNHLLGQRGCFNCSSEASTTSEGSVECACTGANRRFQPSDGRCPCQAGFIQYEGRIDGDCQPIVYPLCGENQIRSQDGVCRTLDEWVEYCSGSVCRSADLFVELDRSLGTCVCQTQVLDDVCDPSCQQSNLGRLQIMCTDPPMAVITDDDGDRTYIELSGISGLFSTNLCSSLDGQLSSVFTVDTAGNGFRGNYMPGASALVSMLSPQQTNTTARRRRQAVADPTPQFSGIDDPLVCLEVDQSLLFMLSNTSYPVYDENNLLNSNADFDLGLFSQLVEDQLLTGDNLFFAFRFTESGLFSFYLSDTPTRYMYVRVVEPTSQCPEVGPFYPASPLRAVQLGMVRSNDIVQDPNWALIGGLLGGGVAIMIAMVIILLLFRQYGWSKPVFHKPKYRRSNKRLNLDHFSSKGSALMSKRKAHPMQEVVTATGAGVGVSAAIKNDDFWDYDGQVDLEAFSSKQLYTKLADQSHRVVSTIGGQKEQAKALFHKLQNEADSLKELWVAKLNLQGRAELASPEQLREYETIKEKYSNELDRRKLLCQQFGVVLATQLQLLEDIEGERQSQRVRWDSFFMEVKTALSWMKELRMKDGVTSSSEITELAAHVKSLISEFKTGMESHCSQLGLTSVTGKHTGAKLVSMETGEVLSLQQIQNAITNENESVVVKDASTGLIKPGPSTRLSLPSGITREVPPNHFVDLTSGHVLPVNGNVHYSPVSLKLVLTRDPPSVPPAKSEPLIPFIPYPMNPETGEPVETGLEVLDNPSQLKLGGAMKDPSTGLCVPICGVTIHPRTKSLLPVGGAYYDPITSLLVPIEIGGIMIDSATTLPVPILCVGFHPHSGKAVPVGGYVIPSGEEERKAMLVGERFTDPLSGLPLRVSSVVFSHEQNELVPSSGDYQTFLDTAELSMEVKLLDSLVILQDLAKTASKQEESLLAEKFAEVEKLHSHLTHSRHSAQVHSLKTLHSLAQRITSCEKLSQTGGSPCFMEYKPTGQPLPLLLGYLIPDPSTESVMVPVLDYQVSPITGMGEPIAGTMESVDGRGRVPITVGERMYSEAVGGVVPVVGARRSAENGVVLPVPQDPGEFGRMGKRRVDRETVQLLEEEVVARLSYWNRSHKLLEKLTSSVDQVHLSVQPTDYKEESVKRQIETVSSASKELTQMVLAEKQRHQLSKSDLLGQLPPDVTHLLTSGTDDELGVTESHAPSLVRFTEVTEKLLGRVVKEEQSYQTRVQQALDANNPEAQRQLTRNHQEKMATLRAELKQQLLSQRQLLYQSEASLSYLRSKAELSCQLAKSLLAGEVVMPSTAMGYSSLSEGGRGKIREYAQLLPLLEQLVHLVERRGGREVLDGVDDTEVFPKTVGSLVSLAPSPVTISPPQLQVVPSVSVEEVQEATPTKVKRAPLESPSVSGLGVPVMSPDMKKVAKQLIEKHTIENVNLENRLRESENAALKKLYAKIEERKSKVISDSKKEAEGLLAGVEPEAKEKVLLDRMKELQEKLEKVEEEKNEMLETTLTRLVEERVSEKEKLIQAHQSEAMTRNLSSSHLVDVAPPHSKELLKELGQLAELEENLRAEISLELAKEEEERLKREEALRQATMSRHIVEKLKSLDCSVADIQQQQEDMGKLDTTLSERQSALKKRVSSVISERRQSRRKSRNDKSSIQQKANNALIEVAMSELANKEGLKVKKDLGREALINLGGNKQKFMEVLEEYDREVNIEEDRDMTVERREAIAAMKVAQWRLRLEIKKDQQQKEQLKISQSKQATLSGYNDTTASLPEVPAETATSKQKKDELLGEQLKVQVDVELKHQKELSDLEQTAHKEHSRTLVKHTEQSTQQIESSIRQREAEFQQQLASQQGQLTVDEGNRMIAEHQKEMAALRETLKAEQDQQTKVLTNKIAERKRKKAEKLAEKQKLEVDKLLVNQAAAREELELSQRRDQEKEMLDELLKDKDPNKIESIVYHVLKQRHFDETVQLAAQHEREKELAINKNKSKVTAARQVEREALIAEQENEMHKLVAGSTSLSNAELSKQKLELKKQHKKQLTEFDKSTQEAVDKIARRVSPEKELYYNSQVLALRERQIKELAQVISEYSPEQALVKSYEAQAAQAAADNEHYRKEVIEARAKKIAKLKEERRQKEEARKKEREAKLRELEAEIKREKQKDLQRQEQLSERYQLMQQQRIAQQEELHQTVLAKNAGISEQDRQKMIDEHKESMRKMLEGMEQEKKRQVNRLEAEIKRRREKKEQKRRQQLEAEEAKAVQADNEEEERRVDEVTKEDAKQLQTKLEQTARPTTPIVSKPHPPPQPKLESQPAVPEEDVLPVSQDIVSNDTELNRLLMSTPLFSQLSEIEMLLQPQVGIGGIPTSSSDSVSTPYIDVRDAQWSCEGELVVSDVKSLQPTDFVVYRFGVFAANLLEKRVQAPKVTILLATSLPLNNYTRNCFRNSFFYEHSKKVLFVRKERLETVGEFVLLVLHCLAHIKRGDLTDDNDPLFLREFYSAIKVVCQELFFSRVNQLPAGGEISVGAVVKSAPSWEDQDQTVEDLINMEIPPMQPLEQEKTERRTPGPEERRGSSGGVVVPRSNWSSRSSRRPTYLDLDVQPKTE